MIKFVRLQNGDDIITELIPEKDGKVYKLTRPFKLFYQYGVKESYYIVLSPWVLPSICPEQIFHIASFQIISTGEPSEALVHLYGKTLLKYADHENYDELSNIDDESKTNVEKFVDDSLKNLGKKRKKGP